MTSTDIAPSAPTAHQPTNHADLLRSALAGLLFAHGLIHLNSVRRGEARPKDADLLLGRLHASLEAEGYMLQHAIVGVQSDITQDPDLSIDHLVELAEEAAANCPTYATHHQAA